MTEYKNVWNGRRHVYIFATDDGVIHERLALPCYGELRKYESTHVGDCTQPLDPKPGDLHFPFPKEGNPVGVIFPFNNDCGMANSDPSTTDLMFKGFFGAESPWLGRMDTQLTFHMLNGRTQAVEFKDANFDPTVIVNLCKCFRTNLPRAKEYVNLLNAGLSVKETIATMLLHSGRIDAGLTQPGGYTVNHNLSLKRLFGAQPNDHTGGLWKDRIDYNRKRMQDVFQYDETPTSGYGWFYTGMQAVGAPIYRGSPIENFSYKRFADRVQQVFADRISKEKDPVHVPYIWTTTKGVTNEKKASG